MKLEPNPLAVYIRKRRRALDLTQADLSKRLQSVNIDRSPFTISNWETGRQPVPYGLIPALAAVLEEPSIDYMLSLSGMTAGFTRNDMIDMLQGFSPDEINQFMEAFKTYLKEKMSQRPLLNSG